MAIKAVAIITGIAPYTGATFLANVKFAPLVDYSGELTLDVYDIPGDVLSTTLSNDIKNAVKAKMEGEGVTFGLLDTVRVLPAGL